RPAGDGPVWFDEPSPQQRSSVPVKSGIDQADIDPDVRPQDDLFAHVNGRWLATTTIPQDRGRYGTFDVLRETAEEHVRAIIEEVAAGAPEPGTVAAKVGDLYASFM